LQKIRDSYNVNGLGQAAAAATLGDLPYYRRNFQRLIATRERLSAELRPWDSACPAQSN
jgi:histidinol-phosphate aminotransferase